MNLNLFFTLIFFLVAGFSAIGQEKTETFKVYGNCGMCKSRIEKAVKGDGVSSALWNKVTKLMKVECEKNKVYNEILNKKLEEDGHDTELLEAPDKVYEKLPGCCLYDRKREVRKSQTH